MDRSDDRADCDDGWVTELLRAFHGGDGCRACLNGGHPAPHCASPARVRGAEPGGRAMFSRETFFVRVAEDAMAPRADG